MKNLLVFISPTGSFDNPRTDLAANDAGQLVKVQIEQSLVLGWQAHDIILVTNFPYQYGDIKAIVLKDVDFFERKPQVSKINAIIKLFEIGKIKTNEMYWFHDIDAFQLEPIAESEININDDEIAMTDFGGAKHFMGTDRWSGGIIYFRHDSLDIFKAIQALCYKKQIDEEEAVGILMATNPKIARRIKKINNSYNFIGYNLEEVYKKSIKPLKVVHFHPTVGKKRLDNRNGLRFFMGENMLATPLITPNLLKVLKYHKIRENVVPGGVAIFIPTFKRPQKLLRVYKNAKESSPLITNVYFVVEADDTGSIEVLKDNNLPYFINERSRNYAGALNTAYLKTTEKYFFYGADDLDFRQGWLEKCLAKMVDNIKVVGTNDLHHKLVIKGKRATHGLVDRDYIKNQSGVVDETNIVFSETYKHNYIDREFVELAQHRDVYSPCPDSIVEHLHWGSGLNKYDQTYRLQENTIEFDKNNFRQRRNIFTTRIRAKLKP